MTRTVTLVVLDRHGRTVGTLPPFPAAQPWWMQTVDVVEAAGQRFGVDVTVLRLLRADQPAQPGGHVHYAVQLDRDPPLWTELPLSTVDDDLRSLAEGEDPLRAAYARPGGPQRAIAWATAALANAGLGPVLAVKQERTWNLSAIWRLSTGAETFWFKEVPPFFAHEGRVLRWLAAAGHSGSVPGLVAHDGPRLVMRELPGRVRHDAPAPQRLAMGATMFAVQRDVHDGGHVEALLSLGVPDRRSPGAWLTEVARRHGDPADQRLAALVAGLPARLARIVDCGLPDTLVHGDLHPGNVLASEDGSAAVFDWGDCVVGNPVLDILRLTDSLPPAQAADLQAQWARWWREAVPGCDPQTAIRLWRPVQELYYAAVFAGFLAHIEATEHAYHRDDVPACLARAAALADASADASAGGSDRTGGQRRGT